MPGEKNHMGKRKKKSCNIPIISFLNLFTNTSQPLPQRTQNQRCQGQMWREEAGCQTLIKLIHPYFRVILNQHHLNTMT